MRKLVVATLVAAALAAIWTALVVLGALNGWGRAPIAPPGDTEGMQRSTFVIDPGTRNVATFYDNDGSVATHYTFSALAAASLYTSTRDLSRFMGAHLPGAAGEPPGRGVLLPTTLEAMREPQAYRFGSPIWRLGTILYAPNGNDDFIIGHDGNNALAINTAARLNPATGDGIIVLESGNSMLATEIGGEWIFWQTGWVDLATFAQSFDTMLLVIGVGWAVILGGAVIILRRTRKRVGTNFGKIGSDPK